MLRQAQHERIGWDRNGGVWAGLGGAVSTLPPQVSALARPVFALPPQVSALPQPVSTPPIRLS